MNKNQKICPHCGSRIHIQWIKQNSDSNTFICMSEGYYYDLIVKDKSLPIYEKLISASKIHEIDPFLDNEIFEEMEKENVERTSKAYD